MDSVAVAILNWNGEKFLRQFLSTLVLHTSAAIYVIDNASTDASIEFVKKDFPEIKIILLDKNYGFAGGYNKGIKQIAEEYIVLLNSDIEVSAGWIEPLVHTLRKGTNVAACVPKIKSYTNKELFEYAGAAGGFMDVYGFSFCRGRLFSFIEQDTGQYNEPTPVFWGSGAALCVKKSAFELVCGFDDEFFAHMEEIDLCWRLQNYGYTIMYEPASTVYHVGGGTLAYNSPFKTYLNFRNNLYLLYKNLPNEHLKKTIFIRKIFDGVAWLQCVILFKFSHAKAIWKAHIDYYKSLKILQHKRNNSNSKYASLTYKSLYKKSIVIEHFIKRRNIIK